jgi:TATA-binding protein-associated factor Taf7
VPPRVLKIRRTDKDDQSTGFKPELIFAQPPPPQQALVDKNKKVSPESPIPMEGPYDRQCVIRFPSDISERVGRILDSTGTTELTQILKIKINDENYRNYSIILFDGIEEIELIGVLQDLPTFVESYKTINNGVNVTKSSDISQILICFKKDEFDENFESNQFHPSGITPPTARIRNRKFRSSPTPEDVGKIRSAEDLVESVMTGGALEWVMEEEVDEEEAVQRQINEPETVWTPTEEVMEQLRKAGFIDGQGNILGEETLPQPPPPPASGGKLIFARRPE